jgi:DNA-binding PadR family transcriptional regulator
MTVARLVTLGALEQLGEGSGYDITQHLSQKMIDRWTDIKPASIYHAIRQLEKEGAITVVAQTKEGRFPPKTIYTLTEAGRQQFDDLQAEAFLGLYPQFYGFKLALKFNTRRSAAEIAQFAIRAMAVIDGILASMDAYLGTLDPASAQYAADAFFIEHDRRLFLAEQQWIQEAAAWAGTTPTAAPAAVAQ